MHSLKPAHSHTHRHTHTHTSICSLTYSYISPGPTYSQRTSYSYAYRWICSYLTWSSHIYTHTHTHKDALIYSHAHTCTLAYRNILCFHTVAHIFIHIHTNMLTFMSMVTNSLIHRMQTHANSYLNRHPWSLSHVLIYMYKITFTCIDMLIPLFAHSNY